MLSRPAPARFGPFHAVELDNGVSLDFRGTDRAVAPQHYAFLVSEQEFDAVLAQIRDRKLRPLGRPGAYEDGRNQSQRWRSGSLFPQIRTAICWKQAPVPMAVEADLLGC